METIVSRPPSAPVLHNVSLEPSEDEADDVVKPKPDTTRASLVLVEALTTRRGRSRSSDEASDGNSEAESTADASFACRRSWSRSASKPKRDASLSSSRRSQSPVALEASGSRAGRPRVTKALVAAALCAAAATLPRARLSARRMPSPPRSPPYRALRRSARRRLASQEPVAKHRLPSPLSRSPVRSPLPSRSSSRHKDDGFRRRRKRRRRQTPARDLLEKDDDPSEAVVGDEDSSAEVGDAGGSDEEALVVATSEDEAEVIDRSSDDDAPLKRRSVLAPAPFPSERGREQPLYLSGVADSNRRRRRRAETQDDSTVSCVRGAVAQEVAEVFDAKVRCTRKDAEAEMRELRRKAHELRRKLKVEKQRGGMTRKCSRKDVAKGDVRIISVHDIRRDVDEASSVTAVAALEAEKRAAALRAFGLLVAKRREQSIGDNHLQ